jgi:hypothetical protein
MDLTVILAVGALLLSAAGLARSFLSSTDKKVDDLREGSLSLREHEEFKLRVKDQVAVLTAQLYERLVIREFSDWREQFRYDVNTRRGQLAHDLDRINARIDQLDQTRPTAGQLEDATTALKERILKLERKNGD